MTPDEIQSRLAEIARTLLDEDCSCHDWDHTCRVLATALRIGAEEGADLSVLTAAALLHDIARPQEMVTQGAVDHAVAGAGMAADILSREDVGDECFRRHVADCIRTHRYRSRTGEAPATLEARVLFDADKLDSIGAIGLARAFHFAGKTGARVHNSKADALAGCSYGRDDSAYREYLVKLQFVPEKLLTAAGRVAGAQRLAVMQRFFAELDEECLFNL